MREKQTPNSRFPNVNCEADVFVPGLTVADWYRSRRLRIPIKAVDGRFVSNWRVLSQQCIPPNMTRALPPLPGNTVSRMSSKCSMPVGLDPLVMDQSQIPDIQLGAPARRRHDDVLLQFSRQPYSEQSWEKAPMAI